MDLASAVVDMVLLNVLSGRGTSDPYADVAQVGGRETRLREPRFLNLNNEISDDVASRR